MSALGRDYHCELAIDFWIAKIPVACRKSYQLISLLHRLWGTAPNSWAVDPIVHVSSARLGVVCSDRSQLYKLMAKLEKVGALKKGARSRRGVSYQLFKPDASCLSAEVRKQLENLHLNDYLRNPASSLVDYPPLALVAWP